MSDEQNLSELDPFCNRTSEKIAAEIGGAATFFCYLIRGIYSNAWFPLYDGLKELEEDDAKGAFDLAVEEMAGFVTAFLDTFERVRFWWIADTPYPLARENTSLVMELITYTSGIWRILDQSRFKDPKTRYRLAILLTERFRADEMAYFIALHCEIACMSRRPRLTKGHLYLWNTLAKNRWYDPVMQDLAGRDGPDDGAKAVLLIAHLGFRPSTINPWLEWKELGEENQKALIDSRWEEHTKNNHATQTPKPDTHAIGLHRAGKVRTPDDPERNIWIVEQVRIKQRPQNQTPEELNTKISSEGLDWKTIETAQGIGKALAAGEELLRNADKLNRLPAKINNDPVES